MVPLSECKTPTLMVSPEEAAASVVSAAVASVVAAVSLVESVDAVGTAGAPHAISRLPRSARTVTNLNLPDGIARRIGRREYIRLDFFMLALLTHVNEVSGGVFAAMRNPHMTGWSSRALVIESGG